MRGTAPDVRPLIGDVVLEVDDADAVDELEGFGDAGLGGEVHLHRAPVVARRADIGGAD